MKLITSIIIALALTLTACNNHNPVDKSKDQLSLAPNGTFPANVIRSNHGKDASSGARAYASFEYLNGSAINVGFQWCLEWIETNSNDEVLRSGTTCRNDLLEEGNGVRVLSPAPALGGTMVAYESYYIMPGGARCEYHDADDSNAPWCPSRDANGNP